MDAISRSKLFGAILLTLSIGLVHCGPGALQQSSSGITEDGAQADLEQRLARTQEVRLQLDAIHRALAPIESALRDLGKLVDLRLDGLKLDDHPGGAFASLLSRLETAIQEGGNGLVQRGDDGSWVLERPTPAALLSGAQGACARSRVRVVGRKEDQTQRLTVSVSDCAAPDNFQTLATVSIGVNGDREVVISAASIDGFHYDTLKLDPCRLHVGAAGGSELSCSSFGVASGKVTVEFEQLSLRTDEQGTHASVIATLSHAERGWLGSASVVIEPHRKADVCVLTPSHPSCAD
jgi:hypothetical protein